MTKRNTHRTPYNKVTSVAFNVRVRNARAAFYVCVFNLRHPFLNLSLFYRYGVNLLHTSGDQVHYFTMKAIYDGYLGRCLLLSTSCNIFTRWTPANIMMLTRVTWNIVTSLQNNQFIIDINDDLRHERVAYHIRDYPPYKTDCAVYFDEY